MMVTATAQRQELIKDYRRHDGDSGSPAYALSMAIRKIGDYDLILCGRQASDWDGGQVGSGIAELLLMLWKRSRVLKYLSRTRRED